MSDFNQPLLIVTAILWTSKLTGDQHASYNTPGTPAVVTYEFRVFTSYRDLARSEIEMSLLPANLTIGAFSLG